MVFECWKNISLIKKRKKIVHNVKYDTVLSVISIINFKNIDNSKM